MAKEFIGAALACGLPSGPSIPEIVGYHGPTTACAQLSFMWLKARVKRLANGPGQCREATSDWWVTRDPMVPRICTCKESNPLQGQMDVQLQDSSYDFALCSPPTGS